jgi:hypothetical protein
VVVGLTEALRKLDPRRWNGKYEEWLSLMMACKFAGIEREAFIEWSIGDPDYADDGEVIARKWESFAPKHAGALFAALKEAGIKVAKDHTHHHGPGEKSAEVPLGAPTHDLQRRTRSLLAWLARAPSEPNLFSVACVFAEMVDEGRIKVGVARQVLEGACPDLRKTLGHEGVRMTIANAFRHVEEKVLATPPSAANTGVN